MNRPSLPKLNLTHKLCLMVMVPLLVNLFLYNETQRQVNSLEKLVLELSARREIVSRANDIITNEFFAFQALMQYKMFGDQRQKRDFETYISRMTSHVAPLQTLLREQMRDGLEAERLGALYSDFMRNLGGSQFSIDEQNQVGSFFDDLERNQKLKKSMVRFLNSLRFIDQKAKAAVDTSNQAESSTRAQLRNWYDWVLAVNCLMAILVAFLVTQFMVKGVRVIGDNFKRLANHQPLLPPLKTSDELEDLDQNFRSMAQNLESSRLIQLEMMQQVSNSRDKLQVVIDALPSALFITDKDGKVENMNEFAKALFEVNLNYFHQNTLAKAFQVNKEMRSDFMAMLIRETLDKPLELNAITAEKELVPVKVSTVSFNQDDQTKYLTVLVDETEAYMLKQAKSDFFSMISHDMRTPLATISGVLQMTLKGAHGAVTQEQENKLRVALKSSSVLLEMVNRLLQIEKIASAEIELHAEPVDIWSLVEEVVHIIEPQLEAKNLSLVVHDQHQEVLADKTYIVEVIMNLISNAMKYSPAGGEISVSCRLEGDQVFVEVADQGPGVPESKKKLVFERYKQVDKRRDSKIGFGLGLSICKSIVLQHGGSIGVKDGLAGGSIFWFSLKVPEGAVRG